LYPGRVGFRISDQYSAHFILSQENIMNFAGDPVTGVRIINEKRQISIDYTLKTAAEIELFRWWCFRLVLLSGVNPS
jgi:hypothetical protein